MSLVRCAADGCKSMGLAVHAQDLSDGSMTPQAPAGWGEIEALGFDDSSLVLFVCSPACERRLARKLTMPRQGQLDP